MSSPQLSDEARMAARRSTSVRSKSPIPSSAFKMAVFAAITALLIGLLGTLIGNISFTAERSYSALFTDATGVVSGDRVRISGVEVGAVTDIEMEPADNGRQLARVDFTVREGVPLYRDAELELRFESIVGQRYLAIEEAPGGAEEAPAGTTFGVEQTAPALNLTQLFNGFQPLLRGLDPEEVNRISYELVRAFQGEQASYQRLISDTASLTNHLADRDQVIGELITNLDTLLGTVSSRDRQLTALIVEFRDLMTGLSGDRATLDAGLPVLANLLDGTSDFVQAIRPGLKGTIAGLDEVVGGLAADRKKLAENLEKLPEKMRFMVRSGSYGSFFNFYVCGAEVRLRLLGLDRYLSTPGFSSNEADTVCAKREDLE